MALVLDENAIISCCSCQRFAAALAAKGPFHSAKDLICASQIVWWQETPISSWLEAFAAHPKIGDLDNLRRKFDPFAAFSKGEQSTAAAAPEATLQGLADWNAKYEAKFGHIFIICASGKSAGFMLDAIKQRYTNPPSVELLAAAAEQQKITELRLLRVTGGAAAAPASPSSPAADRRAGQILSHLQNAPRAPAPAAPQLSSPITTHVLDTCLGRPAADVGICLEKLAPGSVGVWETKALKRTNVDGRVPDLLPAANEVEPGVYRISFDTAEYMARCKAQHPTFYAERPFYPAASVQFEITPQQTRQHFHVPLTWNPYGYSTYRGS